MSEKAAVIKGHGHVTPNADGYLARCGGPKICKVCMAELAALKQPGAEMDERAAFQEWYATPEAFKAGDSNGWSGIAWAAWQKRAALSAPSHGEQVREGWQLVPVEPTDAMLEAGDKYIGTPATYKSMLSACPSPAITKDFSQFLSAVMDAAGLIRHGRQSKELSEYLGMKCMEYRGAAPSAGTQEQG